MDRFVKLRPHAPFMPPSREGTIIFPGFDGGGEWGGAAVDPARGVLYVNGNEMPWILTMVESKRKGDAPLSDGAQIYWNCREIAAAAHALTSVATALERSLRKIQMASAGIFTLVIETFLARLISEPRNSRN